MEKLGSTGEHLADLSINIFFLKKCTVLCWQGDVGGGETSELIQPSPTVGISVPSPGAGEVSSREHVVTLPSSCNY